MFSAAVCPNESVAVIMQLPFETDVTVTVKLGPGPLDGL
jgi:hypothetical protein